jgi:signal transduction histidine kinase/CheY-like chemotaxis protein/ligand-binding sensor domain-containing protein
VKVNLLLLLLSFNNVSFAQQPLFTNQQHFGVEEGLPQSYISGIIQDEDGFIWLATLDGFCRYDGRGFKTIRYRLKDSTGLAANMINNLGPQVNNTITLYYSPTQADDFNLRTFKVKRNNTRNRLLNIPNIYWPTYGSIVTSANWLFMAADNKGMGWLNSDNGKITYANKANGLLQQDTISTMLESSAGNIYLVSENGVHVSDKTQQKFEWIPFATGIKKHPQNIVGEVNGDYYSIACLPNNRLAVADIGKVIILDINKRSTHIYPVPLPAPGAIVIFGGLQVDSKGRLYFANSGRIFRLTEKGEMKLLWENTATPDQRISAFFIDRSDVLWISINAKGLLKIDLQALPFQSYKYKTNFMSDIMELAGARPSDFPALWNYNEASYGFRQTYDSKGNLYVCYRLCTGLNKLGQQGFHSLPHIRKNSLYSALLTMPDDEIWAFDFSEATWDCWKNPETAPKKIPLDKESMRGIELADAKYIGGFIWLSTYNHGLLQYQNNKRINRYAGKLPNGIMPEMLTEICVDPVDKNKFWIGSRGGGLISWDAEKGLQHVYTTDDGLPNNTIYCILPDKAGKIWCSTNKGIFRFDAITKQVIAFEKTDGLTGNEFNRAHKFIFPDGRLAFGGLDGYTIFNPADLDIKNKRGEVQVLLTGLQINSQVQDITIPNSIIKGPLSTLSVIELPYNKNYLRFEFAAILFNQPQKTKYRYQLKGADNDWIENGNNNIAAYAALRPGRYTLRINATDNNGLWSDTIKEIAIIIHPPLWATWWAYLIYILAALGLVRWYFIFRERRLKTEQNLAFEKREALRLREVDEMKDRFFSNITHEFRTPLTLIITPLEKLTQDPSLSATTISTIKTAQRNSKQLLRLINEFLDFSKLNDGQLKLKLAVGEPGLFTAGCVQSFEAGAKEKNIQLSFFAENVTGLYLFDEDKWGKIITNLLGNALKFTPQNGEVSVLLSSPANDKIRLEVKDNGPGIPLDQQQKIFDRFYQVDDSAIRNYGGTGIGLSLVKELTELMKGTIELDSKPGQSTRFIVNIPVQKMQDNEIVWPVTRVIVKEPGKNNNEQELPLLLVVEDNDELRAFLVESMRTHYRVIEAAEGLKAWDIILQELPDIIISDVMMPGQDGFDLCKLCKTDNRTAHIGFILLTSKAAHDARIKGLGTGADDYITKPFNLEELELRTANLLQLQQKLRAYLQAQLFSSAPSEQLPDITDPFLLQLYQELDANLDDPGLGVDWLCKTMAMSRSTLNRKLKSLLDISPNDLIRRYRLQKARSLLLSGSDITSAAYKVGFSSHSYFSQCFKEEYGITPSEWVSTQV